MACKTCCVFDKIDKYYAPIFTEAELNKVKKLAKKLPQFISHKGAKNVFQIKLVESEKLKDTLACPFLNEETYSCRIYSVRPLDCRLWPFAIAKSQDGKSLEIVCFKKDFCPSLDGLDLKELNYYKKYLSKVIKSKKFLSVLNRHPELAWDHEEETYFIEKIFG